MKITLLRQDEQVEFARAELRSFCFQSRQQIGIPEGDQIALTAFLEQQIQQVQPCFRIIKGCFQSGREFAGLGSVELSGKPVARSIESLDVAGMEGVLDGLQRF